MLSLTAQETLLREALEAASELGLLQFDPLTGELIVWPWYVAVAVVCKTCL